MGNKTLEQVEADFKAAGEGLESKTLQQVAGIVMAIRDKLNDCEKAIHDVAAVTADATRNPHGYTRYQVELRLALGLLDTLGSIRGLITQTSAVVAMTGMAESAEQGRKK